MFKHHWLAPMIKGGGWNRGAEVGVRHGTNLKELMTLCPDLHMVGVDNVEYAASWRKIVTKFGVAQERLEIVVANSVDAAPRFADKEFDFVFIDADHSYEAVCADIDAWTPKCRHFLCGHDYGHHKWPGVTRAIDERFGGRAIFGPDLCWGVFL